MVDRVRIGGLAGRLGVSAATLRHYETLGLLEKPQRTPAGYRLYGNDTEQRMRFILRAKALDLSLVEIRSLLELDDDGIGEEARGAVLEVVARKLHEVRQRAQEAEAFAAQLMPLGAPPGDSVCRCGNGNGNGGGIRTFPAGWGMVEG